MPIFEAIGEVVVTIIGEYILYYLLSVPGAFFRFLLSRCWASQKSLKEYLKDDPVMNGTVGLLLLVLIGVLIALIN